MAKAEEIRANLEKELNLKALNNSKSNNNSSDILFIEYLFYWLEIIRHTVANSTFTSYRQISNNHIKKYFTENPIKSMHITTSRISVATNIAIIAGMFVINISILFINVVVIWLISIISCDTLPTASHLNAKNVMHRNAFSLIFLKSPTIRTI